MKQIKYDVNLLQDFDTKLILELLFKLYDRFIIKVEGNENGEYSLYGRKFAIEVEESTKE